MHKDAKARSWVVAAALGATISVAARAVAPLGGSAFILGWLSLAVATKRVPSDNETSR